MKLSAGIKRDLDRGWKKILEARRALARNPASVKVGLLGTGEKNERSGEALTNVEIGIIHEFGAPAAKIPERSWMRRTWTAKRDEYVALIKRLLPAYVAGNMTAARLLGIVGTRAAADMKVTITAGEGIPPPLKPATVRAKGSDRPLVHTGQLVDAITWAADGGEK